MPSPTWRPFCHGRSGGGEDARLCVLGRFRAALAWTQKPARKREGGLALAALLLTALASVAPLPGVATITEMPSLLMTVLHNAATALLVAALANLAVRKAMK